MALEGRIGNLRYPTDLNGQGNPWVTFITLRPQYADAGTIDVDTTGDSVSMYIPTSYTVSDSIRYETQQEGLLGVALDTITGTNNLSMNDVQSTAAQFANTGVAAGAAGLGKLVAGNAGALTGLLAGGGSEVSGNIQARIQRARRRVMNPREYMLFKAPEMREFPFSFSFIPQTEQEAKDVPKIIQFFREAAYPALHTEGIDYVFPDAFKIVFGGFGDPQPLIRIPEVVCTSVSVTYNPNSISYFRYNNTPVEISIELGFSELKPISKQNVAQGF